MKRGEKPEPSPDDKEHPTDEDAFARAMSDVVPLGPDSRDRVVKTPERASRRPSPDPGSDADAFARAMGDVVPLAPDPRSRVRITPTVAAPQSPQREIDEDVPALFVRSGVDRRELRKLRQGAYPIEDRLDLHGMTTPEACANVARFVENSRHKRRRCVCIVHGRGLHSKDRLSVLRAPVRAALESNPLVLACTDAPPTDGGSGAVYVLLRR